MNIQKSKVILLMSNILDALELNSDGVLKKFSEFYDSYELKDNNDCDLRIEAIINEVDNELMELLPHDISECHNSTQEKILNLIFMDILKETQKNVLINYFGTLISSNILNKKLHSLFCLFFKKNKAELIDNWEMQYLKKTNKLKKLKTYILVKKIKHIKIDDELLSDQTNNNLASIIYLFNGKENLNKKIPKSLLIFLFIFNKENINANEFIKKWNELKIIVGNEVSILDNDKLLKEGKLRVFDYIELNVGSEASNEFLLNNNNLIKMLSLPLFSDIKKMNDEKLRKITISILLLIGYTSLFSQRPEKVVHEIVEFFKKNKKLKNQVVKKKIRWFYNSYKQIFGEKLILELDTTILNSIQDNPKILDLKKEVINKFIEQKWKPKVMEFLLREYNERNYNISDYKLEWVNSFYLFVMENWNDLTTKYSDDLNKVIFAFLYIIDNNGLDDKNLLDSNLYTPFDDNGKYIFPNIFDESKAIADINIICKEINLNPKGVNPICLIHNNMLSRKNKMEFSELEYLGDKLYSIIISHLQINCLIKQCGKNFESAEFQNKIWSSTSLSKSIQSNGLLFIDGKDFEVADYGEALLWELYKSNDYWKIYWMIYELIKTNSPQNIVEENQLKLINDDHSFRLDQQKKYFERMRLCSIPHIFYSTTSSSYKGSEITSHFLLLMNKIVVQTDFINKYDEWDKNDGRQIYFNQDNHVISTIKLRTNSCDGLSEFSHLEVMFNLFDELNSKDLNSFKVMIKEILTYK
ncbi:MAG: hypothetical protein ACRC4L_00105 [Mycoplasma sp.]